MNMQEYYITFNKRISENIEKSLVTTNSYYSALTKNRSFVEEYMKWVHILKDRLECTIYINAIAVYQEAIGCMLMGLYQPAFMGLRYFLERTMAGVYFSANELELRTWLRGNRDTYWTEILGAPKEIILSNIEIEKARVTDNSLFSSKFFRGFFEELEPIVKEYKQLTKEVYRDCSEYVHGNSSVLRDLSINMDYSEDVASRWNDCADTINRCILFILFVRYWKTINADQRQELKDKIQEEFGMSDIIKDYIEI